MASQISMPEGLFDSCEIADLFSTIYRKSRTEDDMFNRHKFSYPEWVSSFAHSLYAIGIDPRDHKILDFGCSYGSIMCAFALNGCKVYGIEKEPEPLEFLRKFWEELPIKQPLQVIEGDYFDSEIWQKEFPDGTKLSDIDIFYSYHGGIEHDQNILAYVLAGPGKAKIGSIARLGGAFGEDEAHVLKEIGYEVIIPGPKYKPLIRKVDSIEPGEGIIKRLNTAYKLNYPSNQMVVV